MDGEGYKNVKPTCRSNCTKRPLCNLLNFRSPFQKFLDKKNRFKKKYYSEVLPNENHGYIQKKPKWTIKKTKSFRKKMVDPNKNRGFSRMDKIMIFSCSFWKNIDFSKIICSGTFCQQLWFWKNIYIFSIWKKKIFRVWLFKPKFEFDSRDFLTYRFAKGW